MVFLALSTLVRTPTLTAPCIRSFGLLRLNKLPPSGTRTKIVCTLGPSTDTAERVQDLVSNGMHVVRLNFSHAGSDYSYPEQCMQLVRSSSGNHVLLSTGAIHQAPDAPMNLRAILVDTKGPEIRTGPLPENKDVIEIATGARVCLTTKDVTQESASDPKYLKLQVDYPSIARSVEIGKEVLLDDGLIALQVVEIESEKVICLALNGGPIKKNKGVNLPGMHIDLPALTDKDKRDLRWACEVGADFVAASFIRTPANVRSVIAYLDRCIIDLPPLADGKQPLRPLVISKIENKEGVDNFDEILEESDGIMVARGDLGVEIPYTKVFAAQKMMVEKCNSVGKPVIVATQMLDSMIRNPRPTRAEVTDVGTAVLDGADAVMLSGETAAGKYPVEALKAMASIAWEADQIYDAQSISAWNQSLHDRMSPLDQELDTIASSAVRSAKDMNAKVITLISMSGAVARAVARHKPTVPVIAFCTDPQVARRLQLHRSITPVMLHTEQDLASSQTSFGKLRAEAMRTAKEIGYARSGDRIIMVDRNPGRVNDMHKFSHNMKVVTLI
ncbi:hypothetical protein MPSEU_000194500 [Mayamaea pseudoterrestris]|nr:hypothetical protein MPSEU_000194500 [Mayamaea pseudoterrestris]